MACAEIIDAMNGIYPEGIEVIFVTQKGITINRCAHRHCMVRHSLWSPHGVLYRSVKWTELTKIIALVKGGYTHIRMTEMFTYGTH